MTRTRTLKVKEVDSVYNDAFGELGSGGNRKLGEKVGTKRQHLV